MAFINDDDKLLENQQNDPQNSLGGGSAFVGASGGADVGGGQVSHAGVGKGGTGGWTNIQSYLNANKNNNSTANTINSQYGSALAEDESKIQNESTKARSDAEGQRNSMRSLSDNLNNNISTAMGGDQQTKDSIANQYRTAFSQGYQGPQSYSAQMSSKSQDYGSDLKKNFGDFLGSFYSRATNGANMSTGQRTLQNQLDTNSESAANAYSDQAARYRALENLALSKNQETNDAINSARTDYQTTHDTLKGDLEAASSLTGPKVDINRTNTIRSFLGLDPIAAPESSSTGNLPQWWDFQGPSYTQNIRNQDLVNGTVTPGNEAAIDSLYEETGLKRVK